jgi:predicted nucleic acid-binding protein
MSDTFFIDTNVLIYARDRKNGFKRERAQLWLSALTEREAARLNMQVLNELTRWMLAHERSRGADAIRAEVESLSTWGNKPVDEDEIDLAWSVQGRRRYHWFDCLLIAAASKAGCGFFLTEDMDDRANVGSVTLINPFAVLPTEFFREH